MKKRIKNETAIFREQFSITQEELAAYLGISYSLLAMHERRLRELPTKALIKFGELLIAHEKSKKSPKAGKSLLALQPAFDKQRDEAIKQIQHKISFHRLGIERMQYILKAIIAKQEQGWAWLNFIDDKLAELSQTRAAKGDRQWLEDQYKRTTEKILRANEQKTKLQLQIALLEGAAGVYEAYKKEISRHSFTQQ